MTSQLRSHRASRALFSAWVLFSAFAWTSFAGAQEVPTPDAGAQDQIAAPKNVAYLTPTPGFFERTILWVGHKIDSPSMGNGGFYPQLDGMIIGSGLSAGPGFRHRLFGDRAVVDASAALSWKRYRAARAQIEWPRLMKDRLALGAQVKYQDFTQLNFFGIGGHSLESNRTNYRLKDIDTLGFATVRARKWLSFTGRAGILRRLDIEPGTSTLYPTTHDRFDEITAPSLVRQPSYLHADIAMDVDTRDEPGYPARGGHYRLSMAAYRDQSFSRYSFRRLETDAAHYVLLGRSVASVRVRLDLSQDAMQDIPFYLLPSLGGADSLRGYADYRFRDRDLLMLNAEYRWPIVRVVDAAVFYDAGTVGATAGSLTHRLHKDYGAGVRVHSVTHMLVRLDVARGSEGTRAVLSITAPLGLASRSVVPYVP